MEAFSQNRSRYWGLDRSVLWVMIVVIILSLGLLGYKKANDQNCTEFSIYTKDFSGNKNNHYLIGEDIRFTISATDTKKIIWNFGDNTEEKGNIVVYHHYESDGKYDVSAMINDKCQSITTVYVGKPNIIRDNAPENSAVLIIGSEAPPINKQTIYSTNATADNYEWSVLNRNEYKSQIGKFVAFSFKTPGKHILQLKLNNDNRKTYTREIIVPTPLIAVDPKPLDVKPFRFDGPRRETNPPPVIPSNPTAGTPNDNNTSSAPKPQPDEPIREPVKSFIEGSEKYFQKSFEEVIRGGKSIQDFDNYLCNGRQTQVLINDNDQKKFEEFFNLIKRNNRRKVEKVALVKEDRCVILIRVTVKKKNVLGVWVDL